MVRVFIPEACHREQLAVIFLDFVSFDRPVDHLRKGKRIALELCPEQKVRP